MIIRKKTEEITRKKNKNPDLSSEFVFFPHGTLNRSCAFGGAHGKQWVSAVLSAIDFTK